MSAEKSDGTIDRLSDANVSFKHYLPSLFSPVAAVAGPWENIVDRDMDACHFFVSTVATCYSRSRLICEKFVSPVCESIVTPAPLKLREA